MKDIISEKALRIFVRNKIRHELNRNLLNEQGKISVSQDTSIKSFENMTFEKCEIKLPPEFKELYNQMVKGRSERAKIDLYTRAMKYGVNADELMVQAAADTGVSRWDLTSFEAGSEILDPTEIETWRKFIESFPGGRFPGGGGGIGIRWSDFPAADAAGEYVWDQLRRAAIVYDKNIGPTVNFMTGKNIVTIADTPLEKTLGKTTTDMSKTKAMKDADPANTLDGQTKATTAVQLVEKWRKFTKARVYILNPKTKKYEVQFISGKRLEWHELEKKYKHHYKNIFDIIENTIKILNQLMTYGGVPGVFCWMAEKVIGHMAKFADYFYEPQEAQEWKRIHDNTKYLRSNYKEETSKFSIKKEINSAVVTINYTENDVQSKFNNSYFESDHGLKKYICLFFPKFAKEYINNGISDIDEVISKFDEDISDRIKEIKALKRVNVSNTPKEVYEDGMKIIGEVTIENFSGRSDQINSTQSGDVLGGITKDIKKYINAALEPLIKYVQKPGCDLETKSAEIESIANKLYDQII
jgi:hypothetical protein